MNCINCGERVKITDKVCSTCGQNNIGKAGVPRPIPVIILMLVIILLIIGDYSISSIIKGVLTLLIVIFVIATIIGLLLWNDERDKPKEDRYSFMKYILLGYYMLYYFIVILLTFPIAGILALIVSKVTGETIDNSIYNYMQGLMSIFIK